jgi:hypothetical protein
VTYAFAEEEEMITSASVARVSAVAYLVGITTACAATAGAPGEREWIAQGSCNPKPVTAQLLAGELLASDMNAVFEGDSFSVDGYIVTVYPVTHTVTVESDADPGGARALQRDVDQCVESWGAGKTAHAGTWNGTRDGKGGWLYRRYTLPTD